MYFQNLSWEREGLLKKKFNLNKLQSAEVKADFQAGLQSKFENSDCPEDSTKKNKDWVQWEQPRDSGTACEEEIISPSPPGSAIMSCEDGCLPSHLQHPPAQNLRDPKWVSGPISQRKQQYADLGDYRGFYKAFTGSVWPRLTGSWVPCAV